MLLKSMMMVLLLLCAVKQGPCVGEVPDSGRRGTAEHGAGDKGGVWWL